MNSVSIINQNLPLHFRKHCQLVLQSSDRNRIFSFGSVYLWCRWLDHPKSSPFFRQSILMPIPLFGTLYFLVHFSSFGSYHQRFLSRQLCRAFALIHCHGVPSKLKPFAKWQFLLRHGPIPIELKTNSKENRNFKTVSLSATLIRQNRFSLTWLHSARTRSCSSLDKLANSFAISTELIDAAPGEVSDNFSDPSNEDENT